MKLVEFSVTNFRSITKAHKIHIHDMTVLVGKNNEGKSNLLTALNIAMEAIIQHSISYQYDGYYIEELYDWKRDFPISLQSRKKSLDSIFTLHFRLEGDEVSEFKEFTGIRSNEDIPITVKVGKDNDAKIEVPKKGSSSYNRKSKQVTQFISKNISFNYIQAVRTEDMALDVMKRAINAELRELKNNLEYADAIKKIDELEQDVLAKISSQLVNPLREFLPNLKKISVKKSRKNLISRRILNDFDVFIDDGELTNITNKGDGIKSLVTLAVLKERSNKKGASVIAIEEPESHLHSGAIHSLVDVLNSLSEQNQIIITTHNPLFVHQNKINANVLVDSGTARPAKNIVEIRNILGVYPSDNLQSARFVLLVEGEDDKISLNKILSLKSDAIKKALLSNQLIIKPLNGASNLAHDALDLKQSLCDFVVLLDNDKAGNDAITKAKKAGLINDSQVKLTICNGSPEAEFEDCIRPEIYVKMIEKEFNISMNCTEFRSKAKWSDRMKKVFLSQGSEWSDSTERRVKTIVADSIEKIDYSDLKKILITEKSGFINGLVLMLNNMMQIEENE